MKILVFSFCLKVVLFLCLMLLSTTYAIDYCVINYYDFKDKKGELIPILPIPEVQVDCDGKCCEKHWGAYIWKEVWNDKLERFITQSRCPPDAIIENGRLTLKKISNIHNFDLYVPPPFFWEGTDVTKSLYYYDYRDPLMEKFVTMFFCPAIPNGRSCRNYPSDMRRCLSYSQFSKKYDYLEYWYDLCYELQCKKMDRILQDLRRAVDEAIKNNYRGGYFRGSYYTLGELERQLEWVSKKRSKLEENIKQSSEVLQKSRDEMTRLFIKIYDDCIEDHVCPNSIYHRGKIAFSLGDTVVFIGNVFSLISSGYDIDSESLHQLGQAYNEANQYDQAIRVLSECIENDPQNSEVYLDRAVAYFETGQFGSSLQDYLDSGLRPTYLDDDNLNYLQVCKGVVVGACRGAIDSSIDFFPSLLSTIKGLGRGLWTLSENPIGVSKELIENGTKCLEYLKEHASLEYLQENMSTLQKYIEHWHEIDDEQKGYCLGYAITHFGVDALACSGSIKAVKSFRDLKRANAMLTMDYAACSSKNLQEIIKSSETFSAAREKFKRENCKMQIDSQGKHYPKAHNFDPTFGRSEIFHSPSELEALCKQKIGTGIPHVGEFGSSGYREYVDFEIIIGEHISPKTKLRTPTTIGEIHYKADGKYHVVPVHPSKFLKK